MSFNHQVFRAHLQGTLQRYHLSLREAAKQSGVSASTLSRLLKGETPDMETFATLTHWLGADVSAFFDHEHTVIEDEAPAWAMLYTSLEVLDMPADFIEATAKLVQVLREKRRSELV